MSCPAFSAVMPALVAGIHAVPPGTRLQDVDGRDKPGHDKRGGYAPCPAMTDGEGLRHAGP